MVVMMTTSAFDMQKSWDEITKQVESIYLKCYESGKRMALALYPDDLIPGTDPEEADLSHVKKTMAFSRYFHFIVLYYGDNFSQYRILKDKL